MTDEDGTLSRAVELDQRRMEQIERQKWRLTVLMDFIEGQGLLSEFNTWEAERNDATQP